MPIGTPVAASISGDSHKGSSPAKTSALRTERCAVRLKATLSPGFPSARITAWFACVEPPVENRAKSAPQNSAASDSALTNTWLVNLISSRPPYKGISESTTAPRAGSICEARCLCPGIVNGV